MEAAHFVLGEELITPHLLLEAKLITPETTSVIGG